MNKELILKRLFEAEQITFEELMILSKDVIINKDKVVYKNLTPIIPQHIFQPQPIHPYWTGWQITCDTPTNVGKNLDYKMD